MADQSHSRSGLSTARFRFTAKGGAGACGGEGSDGGNGSKGGQGGNGHECEYGLVGGDGGPGGKGGDGGRGGRGGNGGSILVEVKTDNRPTPLMTGEGGAATRNSRSRGDFSASSDCPFPGIRLYTSSFHGAR